MRLEKLHFDTLSIGTLIHHHLTLLFPLLPLPPSPLLSSPLPKVMAKLRALFTGYASTDPAAVTYVLMGNFLSAPYGKDALQTLERTPSTERSGVGFVCVGYCVPYSSR